MDLQTINLIHANDLRSTWQARALAAAEGRMMVVVSSVLSHTYDEAMWLLFDAVRPKCWDVNKHSLKTPFLCSTGKIQKNGTIAADVVLDERRPPIKKVLFADERDFEYEFRKLADGLKLSDDERVELFAVAKRWVVSDSRLDPTFDPKDPDAKRLVH